jgi:hypothetical protein
MSFVCQNLLKASLLLALCLLVPQEVLAANGARNSKRLPAARTQGKIGSKAKPIYKSPQDTVHDKIVSLRQAYRTGTIQKKVIWEKLDEISSRPDDLRIGDRILLLNTQTSLLMDAGYPTLAAIYAAQTLRLGASATGGDMQYPWATLRNASINRPIHTILEVVALESDLQGRSAPAFGSDWNYFLGNAAAQSGDARKAIEYYQGLKYGDTHYFSAKYQEAMLLVEQEKLSEAEAVLKKILIPMGDNFGPAQNEKRRKIMDFAYMALGRIYYEQQRFLESIKMYRSVDRHGMNFYDALYEQAWAFFMGGYPMHALGAIHGAESPFYADVFNPEATLLKSMIHYWLCRYDDSRNALADFMEKYQRNVEQLKNYLDRRNLEPEVAYQLFENLVSGVSSESLGLPKAILETAAEKDSMLFARDQYASFVAEKGRLDAKGVFGSKIGTAKAGDTLGKWLQALRKDLGRRYLAELNDMKRDFDRLYSQAEFLYVELLMSEKDQILGKELHASTKITHVSSRMKVTGWGDKTQSWRDPINGEYWWDEIGFYIAPIDSMCGVSQEKKN